MIRKIYSLIEPGRLTHVVIKNIHDEIDGRMDISEPEEPLQLAILNFNEGKTFFPHKHIPKLDQTTITQEAWIILRGKVKAILYDLDDEIIEKPELETGDIVITYYGGHNYYILEDNTLITEVKTGPYRGQKADKVKIESNAIEDENDE